MKIITFYGAAGTVTGSNFLITDNNDDGILVDMGMFQGSLETEKLNHQPLEYNPQDIHTVLLTHAHLDHCGRLPLLIRHGFRGRIYATKATKELTEIVLMDSAKINERSEEMPFLYSTDDAKEIMSRFETVQYDEPLEIDKYKIRFIDAGHILGSASINIEDTFNNKSVVFSGDLGNSPESIVRPTEYFNKANYVVMETTYGDRVHPDQDPSQVIANEIQEIEKSGGVLLIPSFSIERTQAILHIIDHLKKDKLVKAETRVFLDSPMGQKATEIYTIHKNLYNEEMTRHAKMDNPFDFPGYELIDSAKKSKNIKKINQPKVIIAGSGMMSGGRIANHAIEFLPQKTTRLLIVGYQAEGTPGRAIEEGAKEVEFYETRVQVNASVNSIHSMSAHADKNNLVKWLSNIKGVEGTFLVHGEDQSRDAFEQTIKDKQLSQKVHKPALKESFVI